MTSLQTVYQTVYGDLTCSYCQHTIPKGTQAFVIEDDEGGYAWARHVECIDLPIGYRWATSLESDNPPHHSIIVGRTFDSAGKPYLDGEADLAVKITALPKTHSFSDDHGPWWPSHDIGYADIVHDDLGPQGWPYKATCTKCGDWAYGENPTDALARVKKLHDEEYSSGSRS